MLYPDRRPDGSVARSEGSRRHLSVILEGQAEVLDRGGVPGFLVNVRLFRDATKKLVGAAS